MPVKGPMVTPAKTRNNPKRVLALSSSSRPFGNSRALAEEVLRGAADMGHDTELAHIADHVTGLFRNCRDCRDESGECTLKDGYKELLLEKYIKADAIVYASPIYWYGFPGNLKNFFDRFFCYICEGYPGSKDFIEGIKEKKVALVMAAEENNYSARLGMIQAMTQMCDYLHHDFVGIVQTTANSRSDVHGDPNEPLKSAYKLGTSLFDITETNYRVDLLRGNVIWEGEDSAYKRPTFWG